VAQALQFELRPAGAEGDVAPIGMKSGIEVRRIGEGERLRGVVRSDRATFLKAVEGWERWGNWIDRTPFPIVERYGERLRVDFGRGASGFVEAESVAIGIEGDPISRARSLGAAVVQFHGEPHADRLTIEWRIDHPIAHVFESSAARRS
jgi:hypothetical protein